MATLTPKQKRGSRNLAVDVRERTNNGEDIVDYLLGVMGDSDELTHMRLQAAGMLLDRGFGKAQQIVTIETEVVNPLRRFTLADLLLIREQIASVGSDTLALAESEDTWDTVPGVESSIGMMRNI
jgi:hypothetical protein